MKATLLGPDGVVELDAWKDATPIFTTSVTVQNGRAEVTLPLDASMAGVLRLHTHTPDRTKTAPRATLLVTRGRALDLEYAVARPDQRRQVVGLRGQPRPHRRGAEHHEVEAGSSAGAPRCSVGILPDPESFARRHRNRGRPHAKDESLGKPAVNLARRRGRLDYGTINAFEFIRTKL